MSETPYDHDTPPLTVNVLRDPGDYHQPVTPEDYARQAAVSIGAIAEMEHDALSSNPNPTEARVGGDIHALQPGETPGWSINYTHVTEREGDREGGRVTVRRTPSMPEYNDDTLTLKQAAFAAEQYRAALANTPVYEWSELQPDVVVREHRGVRVELTAQSNIGLLVEAHTTLRTAAINTAHTHGREDMLPRLAPADE